MKYLGSSKTKTAHLQIEELSGALDLYHIDVGNYPNTQDGLAALITAPANAKHWNGPYLKKGVVPKDPWDHDYHYAAPGEHGIFDLYSLGADNRAGGDGENQDIVSWR
jgi:general secretion pathway protein G